jgi:hypothetical protein
LYRRIPLEFYVQIIMPRKRKNTAGSTEVTPEKKPAVTRRSTRIAEAVDKKPSPAPVKQSPRRGRKRASQSDEEASTSMDHSLNESVGSNAEEKTTSPRSKKGRKSPKKATPTKEKDEVVTSPSATGATESKEEPEEPATGNGDDNESDLVHVSTSDVPDAESSEVKEATAAQDSQAPPSNEVESKPAEADNPVETPTELTNGDTALHSEPEAGDIVTDSAVKETSNTDVPVEETVQD